ncbi:hypothetical protein [Gilvimarinus polysaccharolyticus]|uniref:hypothetical protein n=1 Tax=Gilvimarinus polysaccharolyticus TaxID=863921 RepID=UPI000673A4C4|nr:hypothetical protein [Gilvimarinus polysaccharolyticus]
MQVVNFYIAEFQPDRSALRASHIVWALLLTLVLLVVYSLWYHSQSVRMAQQQVALQTQMDASKSALLEVLEGQKSLNINALRSELTRSRAEIKQRKRALDVIETQDMGNTEGFSQQLRALASLSLPAVSLESFMLLDGGAQVGLAGRASEPEAVPRYLALLHNSAAFSRTSFGVLTVAQNEGAGFPFAVAVPTVKEGEHGEP